MTTSRKTVLVTGARGFLGSAICRSLSADPALEVLAGTRDGIAGARLNSIPNLRITPCDVTKPDSLSAAMDGVAAVVHCAFGDRSVTTDGTGAVLEATTAANVAHLIHISSIAVHGSASGLVTEQTALIDPDLRGYAHDKAAAEGVLHTAAGRIGTEGAPKITILRPTIIYGPGSILWIDKMADRLRSGGWGPMGAAGDGICNPVHVRDVADAIHHVLNHPDRARQGAAYIINGPETLSWNHWFLKLNAALRLPTPPLRMAKAVNRHSKLSLPVKALLKFGLPVPQSLRRYALNAPAGSELSLFALEATYSPEKTTRELGWTAKISVDEGLADSVAPLRPQQQDTTVL